MSTWKVILAGVAIAGLLWLLYPARQTHPAQDDRGAVEITFMGPGGPIAGAMADAVGEFERLSREAHAKDPARPIYRVVSGQNAAANQVADPTRFLISLAGGMPPDVVYFDRYAVAEWAARGAFTPLDEYVARDLAAGRPDTPRKSRFYPACWDEVEYQGKLYGIPNSIDDRALFYNKDLLRRAGLVDEHGQARPPRDWEELEQYAVKLTERNGRGNLKVVGFAPRFAEGWLYLWGWMAGGEYMSPDGTRCTLNAPGVVRGLAFMTEIYDKVAPGAGYAEVTAFQAGFQGNELDPFIQGKIAMKIDGFGALPLLSSFGRGLNFGVAPPPMPKDQLAKGRPAVTWSGGWAYAIPTNARRKDAAWEFIRFMASDRALSIVAESNRELAESQGQVFIPAQAPIIELNQQLFEKYVYGNPRTPQNIKDGCRVMNDLLPDSRFRPVTPVGQLLWNEQVNAMEAALYHHKTPRQALDDGAAVVQRDLDRVLHPVKGRPFNWLAFAAAYAVLILAMGTLVYLWDTRSGFRSGVNRWLLKRADGGTIEGSRGGYFRRQWAGGVACAAPWIVGFLVFGGGPMLFSLVISFCDYDVLNPPAFTGTNNYQWMFTQDTLFPLALGNTLYMLIGVPLGMAASLAIALLLNLKIRGIAVWRTFFYLPSIVPLVAASVLWIWIFNPEGGLINLILRGVGIGGPLWLQAPQWSKPALIIMGLWGAGGGMIIWLAGLKGINEQLYEAVAIDGANTWQKFVHITLPQLTPYIFFNLIMGLIGTFQIFSQAFIMTQGGPVNSTLFYVYHLFNNAFRYGHMGYASAMAWVLFVIVLGVTIVQWQLSKRWVHYEGE